MKNCILIKNFFQLEKYALKRARHIAENNDFSQDAGNNGENQYVTYTWFSNSDDLISYNFGEEATTNWYREINVYDYSHPGFSSRTGHFTQMVWKDTTKLGCAAAKVKDSDTIYVVCNYSKPGNLLNGFEQNVLPPIDGNPY